LYSCGPTVYSMQHVGNMRAAWMVDFLRRVLTHVGGYDVDHVMNITDVGHLKYTDIYLQDLAFLGISASTNRDDDAPIFMPRATDHIDEQIAMIK